MIMESNFRTTPWVIASILITAASLAVTSASAETYRWKDENGKVYYGAVVPAKYANQPYDVLNDAGLVIEHVENATIPLEVKVEEEITGKKPLISDEERQIQTDRLLLVQYKSEEEIQTALELEIAKQ